MYKVTYRITTKSPIVLSTNSGETHLVTTRDFIPGTVVLGMCAARYIEKKIRDREAHRDENFYKWFLSGAISFGNGYIDSTIRKDEKERNIPIPLSIHEDKNKKEEGIDLLIQTTKNQTSTIGGYGRIEVEKDNSNDEDDMNISTAYLYKQLIKKSLNYHHQHDPAKGTVKEGIFFNYEAIEEGQTFTGDIVGEKNILEEFIKNFSKEETFYIGRSRNTQYGIINFSFINAPLTLNSKDETLKPWSDEITLNLISDLIVYNECGISSTDINVLQRILQDYIGNKNLSIKRYFIKSLDIENFVSVWRLKRPSETCFKAGSCFVLQGMNEADRNKLLELKATGIGERKHEGFGRITFMLNRSPLLKISKHEEKKKKKPEGKDGESSLNLTREISLSIIKNILRQHVELEAIRESGDFKNLPSKSLVGRLEAFLKLEDEKCKGFNIDHFKDIISKELKKTASDRLEKCRNGHQTLKEFISSKLLSIERIRQANIGYIKELNNFIKSEDTIVGFENYIQTNGPCFENELYQLYFSTFFAIMRKRVKAGEEGKI